MKLIIEKLNGQVFIYRESEKHFKKVEPERGSRLAKLSELDKNCNLDSYDNCHFVVEIK